MNKKFVMVAIGLLVLALIIGACILEYDSLAGAVDAFKNATGLPVTGSGTGTGTGFHGGQITVTLTLDNGKITNALINVVGDDDDYVTPARLGAAKTSIEAGNIDVVDAMGDATAAGKGIRKAAAQALLNVPPPNGPADISAEWKAWAE